MPDLDYRKELARMLLSEGRDELDLLADVVPETLPAAARLTADLGIRFPAGMAPVPKPLDPRPNPENPLPRADVLVVTWTVAENNGLADVLTPGYGRQAWYFYRRRFDQHYRPIILEGAPSLAAGRLGSWFPTSVGQSSVICFKSELHLNQDGKFLNADGTPADQKTGYATLPVKDLLLQLIDEVRPKLVITTGTSGGVALDQDLGDVVITRGAKFRLADEFAQEPFNAMNRPGPQYTSDWQVPQTYFGAARDLMNQFAPNLVEPDFGPPTKRYDFPGPLLRARPNVPDIHLDGTGWMPRFHPILTTDFFEFGTSNNHLDREGCAVEMGDAVLGLACSELANPPRWLVVRNISDPQINGDLPNQPKRLDMQALWAVWYYEKYGYWTSVTGALACWAVIAGLS